MRIVIAYDSKTGTARECAEKLGRFLSGHEVSLCDLKESAPQLSEFDFAVVGGSVRFGKLSKTVREFALSEREQLLKMGHAFFICCCDSDEAEGYIKSGFPRELRESAVICENFGGELRPERHKGLEKLFVKIARKNSMKTDDINYPNEIKTPPSVLPETISYFSDKIKESFGEK